MDRLWPSLRGYFRTGTAGRAGAGGAIRLPAGDAVDPDRRGAGRGGAGFRGAVCLAAARWQIARPDGQGGAEHGRGLPGAGDLYVTSMGGRTIRLGKLLGAGYTYSEACQKLEGVTLESVDIVKSMARVLPLWEAEGRLGPRELPLLRMLIDVIVDEKPVCLPIQDFAWQDYSHTESVRN